MKTSFKTLLFITLLTTLCACATQKGVDISSSSINESSDVSDTSETTVEPTTTTTTTSEETSTSTSTSQSEIDKYYASCEGLEGDELLSALRTLNSKMRTSTVGYSSMGTGVSSSKFIYTDFDPENYKVDNNGHRYGDYILSFYSGTHTTGWNREHTWPKSHGGNLIEADIHMTRPTIASENGDRGNSFYVEGMADSKYGWDPAMESYGDETYRGDAARIIFYGCIANSNLSLVDDTYHATSNSNPDYLMGKLSDLLKWNLKYGVKLREMYRNEGAEYLQGNRNPFIDHPEYACKIWGNYNDTCKVTCGLK